MKALLDRILDVPSANPDDARRRRLLNILLLGVLAAAMLGLATIVLATVVFRRPISVEVELMLGGIVATTVGITLIYQVNRRFSGRWAALSLLLLLMVIFLFSDTPEQLTNGRSLFLFTLPIIMASILLSPASSFVFAALSSVAVIVLDTSTVEFFPNIPAILGFFLVALASWLSASSLEQTLTELRDVNANLDRLVAERTQALTESMRRERLEASRNQAILNSIADGVIVFDRNWNAVLANPAVKGLLEIPLEQIVGRNLRDLIQQPALTAHSQGLLSAMLEHETQPPSFRIEWNGKTLSVSAAQVYDTRGDVSVNIGTVAVFRDFTREAEVERLKSTFVAMVSHELRTPLNAILGYAEMLKEAVHGPMNEKQLNIADRIMKNTQRLLGLINDLLDQAQMEAGRLTIKMAPVRPAELLEGLHGLMDRTASDKNIKLTSEIDPSLPDTLNGDAVRLQQILVNLVNNAIKFTEGGTVRVRLFRSSSNRWGIVVSDTGAGIPSSEIPHIFDPFRQVDSAATRTHGGFGLGLSIVKQLVSMMNGNIRVESAVGKGSTFMVTLPLVVPEKTSATRS